MTYDAFNRQGDFVGEVKTPHLAGGKVTSFIIVEAVRRLARLRLPSSRYYVAWNGDGVAEVFRVEKDGRSDENVRTRTVLGVGLFGYNEELVNPRSLVARLVPHEEE